MKLSYKNPWLIGAVVIVIGGLIWWGVQSRTQSTTSTPSTQAVERGTLVQSVSGTGSIVAKIQSDVSISGEGRVENILIKDGDTVKPGQPLVKIKSLATPEEIAKAYASYLSSITSLTNAQQQLQDAQKNEAITQTELTSSQIAYNKSKIDAQKTVTDANKTVIDAATTQAAADTDLKIVSAQTGSKSASLAQKSSALKAKVDTKTAQAALQQAQRDAESAALKTRSAQQSYSAAQASSTASKLSYQALTNQTLTAPVGGTIMNMSLVPGSAVGKASNSSDTTTSSTSLFSIVDLNSLRAQIEVNEIDIANVQIGQAATLTFDALADKTLTGKVISIDRLGATTSGVTTYTVEIALDSIDASIRPGMTASASIITAQKNDVLLVPSSAVQTQNNQSTVQILRNGTPVSVPVTVGASNDTQTEITDGVQENDKVVTGQGSATSGSFSNRSSQNTRSGGATFIGAGGFGG